MNWIASHIRGARRLWKTARRAALAQGGYWLALRRTADVWRRQGLPGLVRGVAVLAAQTEQDPRNWGVDPTDYAEWIRRYDTLDAAVAGRLRRRAAADKAPSFGLIVLPEGDAAALDRTLSSVRGQLYPAWRLVADVASRFDAAEREVLDRHAAADARIRCAASKRVSETFVGFLRAGDELAPQALFCAAQRLRERPGAVLLYADEDRYDAGGARRRPWFKPEYNPELMLAQDMFSGFCLLRTDAVRAAGGPREDFGRRLVFELAWRVLDAADAGPEAATRVPRILCHRPLSADRPDAADLAAGLRAAQEHLDGCASKARAAPAPGVPGGIRAVYERPGADATVSILIPTRDRADLLSACVRSVLRTTPRRRVEIVIVDNGSREPQTFALFAQLRDAGARILRDDAPFNYSRLNNAAAAVASGRYLCLLNNDVEALEPGWLDEMLAQAARPDVGCVGARLLYPDGTLQHGGILRGVCGFAGHAHLGLPKGATGYFDRAALVQELSAVTAACLVVRRSVFDQVGGLDETLPESYNDVDFCLRVRRAGYRNIWTPQATLLHRESASRRNRTIDDAPAMSRQERRTTLLMRRRWGALAEDPAYNPNLTRRFCDFGLAWPPRNPPLALL